MIRVLFRNVLSNWLGFACQIAIAFFLTPFVLHSLGDANYGIWMLVLGLTGYYGLLDIGFRAGITQFVTRHLARRDFDRMNATISTAILALSGCGVIIAIASVALSWLAPLAFAIPPEAVAGAQYCIVVIGLSTAIQFVFFPFSSVFAATQRYDISNAIGVATRLFSAAATVLVLRSGGGLAELSLVYGATNIAGYLIRWRVSYLILPQLRVSLRSASMTSLGAIASFGIWSFLSQSAVQLKTYSSTLIIGFFMPLEAIAPFAIATGLVGHFESIFRSFAVVFFPAATHLDATGDNSALKKMYLYGSRTLLLLAFVMASVGVVWTNEFFTLWIGPEFVSDARFTSVSLLFWLSLAACIAVVAQKIGNQILLGTRRVKWLAILLVVEAIANLSLAISLIPFLGLLGAALAALLPAIVFQGLIHPVVLCHVLDISIFDYVRSVYSRPLKTLLVLLPILCLLHTALPSATSWWRLLMAGTLAGSSAIAVLFCFAFEPEERGRILSFVSNDLKVKPRLSRIFFRS